MAEARATAAQAREKVDARREQAEGLEGAIADRAGAWSLQDRSPSLVDRQKYIANPLMDLWFRMEIEGWERLPPPPALLIGIQSGAPFVWDAWTVGFQWWRHFGEERILHGTAHRPGRGRLLPRDGRAPGRAGLDLRRAGEGSRRGAVARRGSRFAAPLDRTRQGGAGRAQGLRAHGLWVRASSRCWP